MKVHNGGSDFINIFASKKHSCALPLFGKIRNSFLYNLENGRAVRSVKIFMPSTEPLKGAFGRYEKIEKQETIKIFSSKNIRDRVKEEKWKFFSLRGKIPAHKNSYLTTTRASISNGFIRAFLALDRDQTILHCIDDLSIS